MASLVEIKKRIDSIASTIKVTKVMQMIATAKIAKIKQIVSVAKRYQDKVEDIFNLFYKYTSNQEEMEKYIKQRKVDKPSLYILFTSDKGTCGSINTNILKEMHNIIKVSRKNNESMIILPIGRKANSFCKNNSVKEGFKMFETADILTAENCDSRAIASIVQKIIEMYDNDKIKNVYVVYNKYKNIITCFSVAEQILPINFDAINNKQSSNFTNIEETKTISSAVIELYVRNVIYNAYVSNLASIISSRMNAMDNATKNGQEIIDELRITYNKARQAKITSELSDIVSGFEAIS